MTASSDGSGSAAGEPAELPAAAAGPSAVVARLLDGALECAVASFALWTVLYHLALVVGLSPTALWWVWAAGSAGLVLARVRFGAWVPAVAPARGTGWVVALASAAAALASAVVRPDLDDASYMVRAAWVAARGRLGDRDVIFSDGRWHAMAEQNPYLPSIETLFGMTSHVTGISAGTVAYTLYVPVAAFAAVWALWLLLRAWRVRRPLLALLLACTFLLVGGDVHASWGNLHLARIWQGKVTLLAVLVPVAYAWAARYWESAAGARRWVALALVGLVGVAATGLSPAGIFVVPGVIVIAAVVGLFLRRVGASVALAVAGALYPLGAGLVVKLVGDQSDSVPSYTVVGPWERTLGTGTAAVVVLVAAIVAIVGLLVPRLARTEGRIGAVTAGASALAGMVIAIPAVSAAAVSVMGTDAIAWRIVWVVPVPALVGMLAAPTGRGRGLWSAATAVVAAVVLVVGGLPIWSPQNGATVGAPGSWKMWDRDLTTARWVVDQAPAGRYLARVEVVAAVGTLSADLAPVGSRPSYMYYYADDPEAQMAQRSLLQNWVDGVTPTPDPALVADAIGALDVSVVCGPGSMGAVLGAGWEVAYQNGMDTCWRPA